MLIGFDDVFGVFCCIVIVSDVDFGFFVWWWLYVCFCNRLLLISKMVVCGVFWSEESLFFEMILYNIFSVCGLV